MEDAPAAANGEGGGGPAPDHCGERCTAAWAGAARLRGGEGAARRRRAAHDGVRGQHVAPLPALQGCLQGAGACAGEEDAPGAFVGGGSGGHGHGGAGGGGREQSGGGGSRPIPHMAPCHAHEGDGGRLRGGAAGLRPSLARACALAVLRDGQAEGDDVGSAVGVDDEEQRVPARRRPAQHGAGGGRHPGRAVAHRGASGADLADGTPPNAGARDEHGVARAEEEQPARVVAERGGQGGARREGARRPGPIAGHPVVRRGRHREERPGPVRAREGMQGLLASHDHPLSVHAAHGGAQRANEGAEPQGARVQVRERGGGLRAWARRGRSRRGGQVRCSRVLHRQRPRRHGFDGAFLTHGEADLGEDARPAVYAP